MNRRTQEMPPIINEAEQLNTGETQELLKPRKRKKRRKKRYLLKTFIVLCLIGAALFVMSTSYFNIKTIEVEGNATISAEQAVKDTGIKTGDNIFFLNKRHIVKELHKKNPLYGDVKIDRRLPDRLVIDIAERTPAMALPYGEKYVVLDKEGVVLDLAEQHPRVTEIEGITILSMNSGEVVEPKETNTFEQSKEIVKTAAENDLFFKSVSIGKKEVVCNVYDRLYVRCTYDELINIMTNGNLEGILQDLYNKKIKRGTVEVEDKKYCLFSPTFK